MAQAGRPPKTYNAFIKRFPKIAEAWELIREAEGAGGLDEKSLRLVKLAIAVGGMREGAVHSSVRKALAAGASRADIEQVVALAASTIGLPSTVAIYSWVLDEFEKAK